MTSLQFKKKVDLYCKFYCNHWTQENATRKISYEIAIHLQTDLYVDDFGSRFKDKIKLEVLASAWSQRHKKLLYVMTPHSWW